MRTEDLIDKMVAADIRPVGRYQIERRAMLAAGGGLAAGLAALSVWLGLRPDLAHAAMSGPFWMKLGFTLAVTMTALALSCRLVRPACSSRAQWWAAAAPFVLIVAAAVGEMALTPAPDRMHIWLGYSWDLCAWRILLLSLPAFVALLWTFRQFAPTRLRLAGFIAGLVAGGVGASAYAFTCTETTAAFVATWYTLGMFGVAALGALVGPRALRW